MRGLRSENADFRGEAWRGVLGRRRDDASGALRGGAEGECLSSGAEAPHHSPLPRALTLVGGVKVVGALGRGSSGRARYSRGLGSCSPCWGRSLRLLRPKSWRKRLVVP